VSTLKVATLNVRNLADRWDERLPLLLADMAALQPDVIGMQEVVYPLQQDRILGAAGEGRYEAVRGWAGRPEYGNSILVRTPLRGVEDGRVDLGRDRAAHSLTVDLDGGATIRFAVTHLHHLVPDDTVRDEQTATLLGWLDAAAPVTATILVGDFNADPAERAYRRLTAAGFRSAHLEVHGVEPVVTWPSGIQAPGMDTDGDPGCLDYIWLRGEARALSARLVFDRPAVGDPTLYPSDHFGLAATVAVGGA
jgi:endonuclease/exonuclease/phosphatase family metal-dependent hydrolase